MEYSSTFTTAPQAPIRLRRRGASPQHHKPSGFTLVELLVVVGILTVAAGVAGGIFASILRAYNKANILNEVEQNGSYALSVMEQQIRAAGEIVSPEPSKRPTTQNSITIVNQENEEVTYAFSDSETVGPGCENGKVEKSVGGSTSDLTNTDNIGGIDVESLSFFVSDTTPATVTITIGLSQACNASSRIDYQAQTTLSTTVSLRGY